MRPLQCPLRANQSSLRWPPVCHVAGLQIFPSHFHLTSERAPHSVRTLQASSTHQQEKQPPRLCKPCHGAPASAPLSIFSSLDPVPFLISPSLSFSALYSFLSFHPLFILGLSADNLSPSPTYSTRKSCASASSAASTDHSDSRTCSPQTEIDQRSSQPNF